MANILHLTSKKNGDGNLFIFGSVPKTIIWKLQSKQERDIQFLKYAYSITIHAICFMKEYGVRTPT